MKSATAWMAIKRIRWKIEEYDDFGKSLILVNLWVNLYMLESNPENPFQGLLLNLFVKDGKISNFDEQAYFIYYQLLHNNTEFYNEMVRAANQTLVNVKATFENNRVLRGEETISSKNQDLLDLQIQHLINLQTSKHAVDIIEWTVFALLNNTNLDSLKLLWAELYLGADEIDKAISFRRSIIDKLLPFDDNSVDPDIALGINSEVLKSLSLKCPKFMDHI